VRIERDPANATITYRRTEETAQRNVAENQLRLPEGTYVFSGRAVGYTPRSVNVTVRAEEMVTADLRLPAVVTKKETPVDPMEKYWVKGVWSPPEDGWYIHKGEGFLAAAHSGPASILFSALLPESGVFNRHKLVWAVNYIDDRNYVRYELTDKEMTIRSLKDGHGAKTPVKMVKAGTTYTIRLDWRAGSISVSVNGEAMGELKGEFEGGKFGFLGNKEVRMSNFRLEP
jgi:hypothetical protein